MNRLRVKALWGGLTAVAYLLTNVVGAYAAEGRFWEERRSAAHRLRDDGNLSSDQQKLLAQLPAAGHMDFRITEPSAASGAMADPSVPRGRAFEREDLSRIPSWISTLVLPYAAVRDIHLSSKPGAPLVIHVQDAHGIEDAQRNIAGLIEGLKRERGISLVGLEGASGAFALDPFRAYPDPAVTKSIADFFLKEGTLTGAEYAGLTSAAPPVLWGVENMPRYEDNIKSFKASLANKPAVSAFLKGLTAAAAEVKEAVYAPVLKEFDRRYEAYQDRREGLGAYVKYLLGARPVRSAAYPNLRLLSEALAWEEGLDFKRVEQDRLRLVEALSRRLPRRGLDRLLQESLLYRAGRMTYGDYYRFLKGLCADNRISLSEFGSLDDYITYVLVAERINRNDLLDELAALEAAVQDGLASTPAEKRLVQASRDLSLLRRLTDHAMTPADWLAYQSNKKRVLSCPLEIKVAALGLGTDVPTRPQGFEGLLAPFEDFCGYAIQRNNFLVDNLLGRMETEKASAAVLVAGGFHTEGLTEALRRRDASYVVLTPKIDQLPKENKYLDVFARDPMPLEKMFQGDRIDLVMPLVTGESNAGAVRALYYKAADAILQWAWGRLPEDKAVALTLRIPGIVEADFDGAFRPGAGRTVKIRFTGEERARSFEVGGKYGKLFESGTFSTRITSALGLPIRDRLAEAGHRLDGWLTGLGARVLPAGISIGMGAVAAGGLLPAFGAATAAAIGVVVSVVLLGAYLLMSGAGREMAPARVGGLGSVSRWMSEGLIDPLRQAFMTGTGSGTPSSVVERVVSEAPIRVSYLERKAYAAGEAHHVKDGLRNVYQALDNATRLLAHILSDDPEDFIKQIRKATPGGFSHSVSEILSAKVDYVASGNRKDFFQIHLLLKNGEEVSVAVGLKTDVQERGKENKGGLLEPGEIMMQEELQKTGRVPRLGGLLYVEKTGDGFGAVTEFGAPESDHLVVEIEEFIPGQTIQQRFPKMKGPPPLDFAQDVLEFLVGLLFDLNQRRKEGEPYKGPYDNHRANIVIADQPGRRFVDVDLGARREFSSLGEFLLGILEYYGDKKAALFKRLYQKWPGMDWDTTLLDLNAYLQGEGKKKGAENVTIYKMSPRRAQTLEAAVTSFLVNERGFKVEKGVLVKPAPVETKSVEAAPAFDRLPEALADLQRELGPEESFTAEKRSLAGEVSALQDALAGRAKYPIIKALRNMIQMSESVSPDLQSRMGDLGALLKDSQTRAMLEDARRQFRRSLAPAEGDHDRVRVLKEELSRGMPPEEALRVYAKAVDTPTAGPYRGAALEALPDIGRLHIFSNFLGVFRTDLDTARTSAVKGRLDKQGDKDGDELMEDLSTLGRYLAAMDAVFPGRGSHAVETVSSAQVLLSMNSKAFRRLLEDAEGDPEDVRDLKGWLRSRPDFPESLASVRETLRASGAAVHPDEMDDDDWLIPQGNLLCVLQSNLESLSRMRADDPDRPEVRREALDAGRRLAAVETVRQGYVTETSGGGFEAFPTGRRTGNIPAQERLSFSRWGFNQALQEVQGEAENIRALKLELRQPMDPQEAAEIADARLRSLRENGSLSADSLEALDSQGWWTLQGDLLSAFVTSLLNATDPRLGADERLQILAEARTAGRQFAAIETARLSKGKRPSSVFNFGSILTGLTTGKLSVQGLPAGKGIHAHDGLLHAAHHTAWGLTGSQWAIVFLAGAVLVVSIYLMKRLLSGLGAAGEASLAGRMGNLFMVRRSSRFPPPPASPFAPGDALRSLLERKALEERRRVDRKEAEYGKNAAPEVLKDFGYARWTFHLGTRNVVVYVHAALAARFDKSRGEIAAVLGASGLTPKDFFEKTAKDLVPRYQGIDQNPIFTDAPLILTVPPAGISADYGVAKGARVVYIRDTVDPRAYPVVVAGSLAELAGASAGVVDQVNAEIVAKMPLPPSVVPHRNGLGWSQTIPDLPVPQVPAAEPRSPETAAFLDEDLAQALPYLSSRIFARLRHGSGRLMDASGDREVDGGWSRYDLGSEVRREGVFRKYRLVFDFSSPGVVRLRSLPLNPSREDLDAIWRGLMERMRMIVASERFFDNGNLYALSAAVLQDALDRRVPVLDGSRDNRPLSRGELLEILSHGDGAEDALAKKGLWASVKDGGLRLQRIEPGLLNEGVLKRKAVALYQWLHPYNGVYGNGAGTPGGITGSAYGEDFVREWAGLLDELRTASGAMERELFARVAAVVHQKRGWRAAVSLDHVLEALRPEVTGAFNVEKALQLLAEFSQPAKLGAELTEAVLEGVRASLVRSAEAHPEARKIQTLLDGKGVEADLLVLKGRAMPFGVFSYWKKGRLQVVVPESRMASLQGEDLEDYLARVSWHEWTEMRGPVAHHIVDQYGLAVEEGRPGRAKVLLRNRASGETLDQYMLRLGAVSERLLAEAESVRERRSGRAKDTQKIGAISPDLQMAREASDYLSKVLFPAVNGLAARIERKGGDEALLRLAVRDALKDDDIESLVALYKGGRGAAILGPVAVMARVSKGAEESAERREGAVPTSEDAARLRLSGLFLSPTRKADFLVLLNEALLPGKGKSRLAAKRAVGAMLELISEATGRTWDLSSPGDLSALIDFVRDAPLYEFQSLADDARKKLPGVKPLDEADHLRLMNDLMGNLVESREMPEARISVALAKGLDRPENQDRAVAFAYDLPGVGRGRFVGVLDGAQGEELPELLKRNAQPVFERVMRDEGKFGRKVVLKKVVLRVFEELHRLVEEQDRLEQGKFQEALSTFSGVVMPDDKPVGTIFILGNSRVRIRMKGGKTWDSAAYHHDVSNAKDLKDRVLKVRGVTIGFVDTREPVDVDDPEQRANAYIFQDGVPHHDVTGGFGGLGLRYMRRMPEVIDVPLDDQSVVAVASDGVMLLEEGGQVTGQDFLADAVAGDGAGEIVRKSLWRNYGGGDNRALAVVRGPFGPRWGASSRGSAFGLDFVRDEWVPLLSELEAANAELFAALSATAAAHPERPGAESLSDVLRGFREGGRGSAPAEEAVRLVDMCLQPFALSSGMLDDVLTAAGIGLEPAENAPEFGAPALAEALSLSRDAGLPIDVLVSRGRRMERGIFSYWRDGRLQVVLPESRLEGDAEAASDLVMRTLRHEWLEFHGRIPHDFLVANALAVEGDGAPLRAVGETPDAYWARLGDISGRVEGLWKAPGRDASFGTASYSEPQEGEENKDYDAAEEFSNGVSIYSVADGAGAKDDGKGVDPRRAAEEATNRLHAAFKRQAASVPADKLTVNRLAPLFVGALKEADAGAAAVMKAEGKIGRAAMSSVATWVSGGERHFLAAQAGDTTPLLLRADGTVVRMAPYNVVSKPGMIRSAPILSLRGPAQDLIEEDRRLSNLRTPLEIKDAGMAEAFRERHVAFNAVGDGRHHPVVYVVSIPADEEVTLVQMTDGVTDPLTEDAVVESVRGAGTPEEASRGLVQLARSTSAREEASNRESLKRNFAGLLKRRPAAMEPLLRRVEKLMASGASSQLWNSSFLGEGGEGLAQLLHEVDGLDDEKEAGRLRQILVEETPAEFLRAVALSMGMPRDQVFLFAQDLGLMSLEGFLEALEEDGKVVPDDAAFFREALRKTEGDISLRPKPDDATARVTRFPPAAGRPSKGGWQRVLSAVRLLRGASDRLGAALQMALAGGMGRGESAGSSRTLTVDDAYAAFPFLPRRAVQLFVAFWYESADALFPDFLGRHGVGTEDVVREREEGIWNIRLAFCLGAVLSLHLAAAYVAMPGFASWMSHGHPHLLARAAMAGLPFLGAFAAQFVGRAVRGPASRSGRAPPAWAKHLPALGLLLGLSGAVAISLLPASAMASPRAQAALLAAALLSFPVQMNAGRHFLYNLFSSDAAALTGSSPFAAEVPQRTFSSGPPPMRQDPRHSKEDTSASRRFLIANIRDWGATLLAASGAAWAGLLFTSIPLLSPAGAAAVLLVDALTAMLAAPWLRRRRSDRLLDELLNRWSERLREKLRAQVSDTFYEEFRRNGRKAAMRALDQWLEERHTDDRTLRRRLSAALSRGNLDAFRDNFWTFKTDGDFWSLQLGVTRGDGEAANVTFLRARDALMSVCRQAGKFFPVKEALEVLASYVEMDAEGQDRLLESAAQDLVNMKRREKDEILDPLSPQSAGKTAFINALVDPGTGRGLTEKDLEGSDLHFLMGDGDSFSDLNKAYDKHVVGLTRAPRSPDVIFANTSAFMEMRLRLRNLVRKYGGFVTAGEGGDEFEGEFSNLSPQDLRGRLSLMVEDYNRAFQGRYDFIEIAPARAGERPVLPEAARARLKSLGGAVTLVRHGEGYRLLVDLSQFGSDSEPRQVVQDILGSDWTAASIGVEREGLGPFRISAGAVPAAWVVQLLADQTGRNDWFNDDGTLRKDRLEEVYIWSSRLANDMLKQAKRRGRNRSFVPFTKDVMLQYMKEDSVNAVNIKLLRDQIEEGRQEEAATRRNPTGRDHLTGALTRASFDAAMRKLPKPPAHFAKVTVTRYLPAAPTPQTRFKRLLSRVLPFLEEPRELRLTPRAFHRLNELVGYKSANQAIRSLAEEVKDKLLPRPGPGERVFLSRSSDPDSFFIAADEDIRGPPDSDPSARRPARDAEDLAVARLLKGFQRRLNDEFPDKGIHPHLVVYEVALMDLDRFEELIPTFESDAAWAARFKDLDVHAKVEWLYDAMVKSLEHVHSEDAGDLSVLRGLFDLTAAEDGGYMVVRFNSDPEKVKNLMRTFREAQEAESRAALVRLASQRPAAKGSAWFSFWARLGFHQNGPPSGSWWADFRGRLGADRMTEQKRLRWINNLWVAAFIIPALEILMIPGIGRGFIWADASLLGGLSAVTVSVALLSLLVSAAAVSLFHGRPSFRAPPRWPRGPRYYRQTWLQFLVRSGGALLITSFALLPLFFPDWVPGFVIDGLQSGLDRLPLDVLPGFLKSVPTPRNVLIFALGYAGHAAWNLLFSSSDPYSWRSRRFRLSLFAHNPHRWWEKPSYKMSNAIASLQGAAGRDLLRPGRVTVMGREFDTMIQSPGERGVHYLRVGSLVVATEELLARAGLSNSRFVARPGHARGHVGQEEMILAIPEPLPEASGLTSLLALLLESQDLISEGDVEVMGAQKGFLSVVARDLLGARSVVSSGDGRPAARILNQPSPEELDETLAGGPDVLTFMGGLPEEALADISGREQGVRRWSAIQSSSSEGKGRALALAPDGVSLVVTPDPAELSEDLRNRLDRLSVILARGVRPGDGWGKINAIFSPGDIHLRGVGGSPGASFLITVMLPKGQYQSEELEISWVPPPKGREVSGGNKDRDAVVKEILRDMPRGFKMSDELLAVLRLAAERIPAEPGAGDVDLAQRYGFLSRELVGFAEATRPAVSVMAPRAGGYLWGLLSGVWASKEPRLLMRSFLSDVAREDAGGTVQNLRQAVYGFILALAVLRRGERADSLSTALRAQSRPLSSFPFLYARAGLTRDEALRMAGHVAGLKALNALPRGLALVGDGANVAVLRKALTERGVDVRVHEIPESTVRDPRDGLLHLERAFKGLSKEMQRVLAGDLQAGAISLPVLSGMIGDWRVDGGEIVVDGRKFRLSDAAVLLQILYDKLVRVDADLLDEGRKAAFEAAQA